MKRRILAFTLALVLALSMGGAALAANGSESHNVTVQVVDPGEETPTVYHVVVGWTDMEFTYSKARTVNNWDSLSHSYSEESKSGEWTDDTATVTVTNHSNTAITATLTITDASASDGVTVTSDDDPLSLAAPAENSPFASAPSGTFTLTANGTPTSTGTFPAGTVKVSF